MAVSCFARVLAGSISAPQPRVSRLTGLAIPGDRRDDRIFQSIENLESSGSVDELRRVASRCYDAFLCRADRLGDSRTLVPHPLFA